MEDRVSSGFAMSFFLFAYSPSVPRGVLLLLQMYTRFVTCYPLYTHHTLLLSSLHPSLSVHMYSSCALDIPLKLARIDSEDWTVYDGTSKYQKSRPAMDASGIARTTHATHHDNRTPFLG